MYLSLKQIGQKQFINIMGNIQKSMEQAKPIEELSSTLKHLEETRSDSQIQITNKLTYLLSDLNTQRIMTYKDSMTNLRNFDWSNYIFVCIQGLPAFKDQFSMLNLPGQTVYYASPSFDPQVEKQSLSERQKFIYETTMKKDAQRLNKLFDSIDKKKKIILIYHSAGNFIMSMFFYYYGQQIFNRICGMVDLAGAPLRYYFSARTLVPIILNTDFKQIKQNQQKIHRQFNKAMKQTGFSLGFKSKFQTLSFLHYIKSPEYGEIFDATWHHPKIVKLIIHGRNDTLFESNLLNQKAIYFCYRRQLEQQYQKKMIEKYEKMYISKKKINNIQERFIFAIPKGQHSIHTQERNHQIIRQAVKQYLILIHE